jgi:hypothetical protein
MSLYITFYLFSWMLILIQYFILKTIIRDVMYAKRVIGEISEPRESARFLPMKSQIPDFTAPVLGSDRLLTHKDLRGRTNIILFVSSVDAASPEYDELHHFVHGLWHKANGNLCLMCSGDEKYCQMMLSSATTVAHAMNVPVIVDRDGSVSRAFRIGRTPFAVMIDSRGRITRSGHPVRSELVRRRQPSSGQAV